VAPSQGVDAPHGPLCGTAPLRRRVPALWVLWVLTAMSSGALAQQSTNAAASTQRLPAATPTDTPTPEAASAAAPTSPDMPPLDEALERARHLLGAGHFEGAARAYEAALQLAEDDRSRAVITFNAGVAWFKAERYELARRWFLKSAMLDPESADAAYLHAAFAALQLRNWEHAAQLLALSGDAPELDAMRQQVATAITAARTEARRALHEEQLSNAANAIARGELARAQQLLDSALAAPDLDAASRCEAHHGLALIALAHDDLVGTGRELKLAAASAADRADLLSAAGDTAERAKLDELAIELYERALAAGPPAAQVQELRQRVAALRAAQDVVTAYGRLGLGWDSNADQSGTNSALGTGSDATLPSAFTSLYGEAKRRAKLTSDTWLEAGLGLDGVLLLAEGAQQFSLLRHDQSLALDFGLGHHLRLTPRAVAAWYLAGLEHPEPFLAEGGMQVRLAYQPSRWAQSYLELDGRLRQGFDDYRYLDGSQLTVTVSQRLLTERTRLDATLQGRLYDVGTLTTALSTTSLPACGVFCTNGTYVIPLGYASLSGQLRESWEALPSLFLGSMQGLEARRYLEDSYVQGGPTGTQLLLGSDKRRRDLRLQLGADATWAWGPRSDRGLTLQWTLLLSDSNVSYDPSSAQHHYDYANRSFTQHLLELSAFVSY